MRCLLVLGFPCITLVWCGSGFLHTYQVRRRSLGIGPLIFNYACYLVGRSVGIRLRSEGCNDADKKPETCGIAYTYVDGMDKSPHGRGHNVVVVDGMTGTLLVRSSMIS